MMKTVVLDFLRYLVDWEIALLIGSVSWLAYEIIVAMRDIRRINRQRQLRESRSR